MTRSTTRERAPRGGRRDHRREAFGIRAVTVDSAATGMLIDGFLPHHDVAERHEAFIAATPARVYRCVRRLDIGRLPMTAALFALRGIPHLLTGSVRPSRSMMIDDLLRIGFVVLSDVPPLEIVLGAVGRFWRPTSGIVRISVAEFGEYSAAGHARAAMNFRIEPEPGGCRLVTETRVECIDDAARCRFHLYWALVGPFSALIRREMLRAIRRDAERS